MRPIKAQTLFAGCFKHSKIPLHLISPCKMMGENGVLEGQLAKKSSQLTPTWLLGGIPSRRAGVGPASKKNPDPFVYKYKTHTNTANA